MFYFSLLSFFILLSIVLSIGSSSCTTASQNQQIAIDSTYCKVVDVTGDGKPDSIISHVFAGDIRSPFSWSVEIRSAGSTIYYHAENDSTIDEFFADTAFVTNCNDYIDCKSKYYFQDIGFYVSKPDTVEQSWFSEVLSETSRFNITIPFMTDSLGLKIDSAKQITKALQKKFNDRRAIILSLTLSPVTSDCAEMFVTELNRFLKIYCP